jgi:hypothetical protein
MVLMRCMDEQANASAASLAGLMRQQQSPSPAQILRSRQIGTPVKPRSGGWASYGAQGRLSVCLRGVVSWCGRHGAYGMQLAPIWHAE